MIKRPSMAVRSSNTNPSHLTPSRFLLGFSAKPSPDTDPTASPISNLDSKPFSSSIAFPFRKARLTWPIKDSGAVGLGIVGTLPNESPDIKRNPSNNESRMVHFGSQLKVQVPTIQPTSISKGEWTESPCSQIEFGVKNKNSQLALFSPALRSPTACSSMVPSVPLPSSDIGLSEYYTCVISHGPNPMTTHIFGNCIVKSCGGCHSYVTSSTGQLSSTCQSDEFLFLCHAGMKSLGSGMDISMSRGEKAFCTSECQHKEGAFDEDLEMAPSGSFTSALLIKHCVIGLTMMFSKYLVIMKNVFMSIKQILRGDYLAPSFVEQ